MAIVLIFGLTPQDYEKVEEIKHAILCAIVNILPEMEPTSGSIGFSCPQDPTASGDENYPVLIVVEKLNGLSSKRDKLEEEIRKYFERASPKEGRRIEVLIKGLAKGKPL